MDFIKTSSLRALIELTFQRNWNGLIWMSRKGVITKRVKTVQTALSRISAQPRSPAGRGTCSARPNLSVRLKSRPKSKPTGRSRNHDPGNIVPRSATHNVTPRRARPCRASREQSLAAAQPTSRTTADASVRAGKERPTSGRETSAKSSSVRPRRPTVNHPATTVPTRPRPDVRPIVPTDRPNAAVDPKPVLKPDFIFSSPA
ncbi:unnamed protein product [Microthlaspi erraticum]|uniref:Uncharacterized protein n=1 Tax=Microthlaspi erraticum TaxID=1685480 RepID=A0A6D2JTJ7_9BRAS|nr:unnamed protein product [Microthlaspi erraticum]